MKLKTVVIKCQVYGQELKEDKRKFQDEDKENTANVKVGKTIQETFAVQKNSILNLTSNLNICI